MSAEEKTTSNINCTDADSNSTKCKEVDDEVIQQFKIIMVVVLIVLLSFLGSSCITLSSATFQNGEQN